MWVCCFLSQKDEQPVGGIARILLGDLRKCQPVCYNSNIAHTCYRQHDRHQSSKHRHLPK